ncbi:TonB-dependent receptor [Sphingobacterium chuzhouense]|nr:TonB-dependent receptor [Sphingobacterium chuzhouense]
MMRIQLVLLSLFLILQIHATDLKAQRLTLNASRMSLENVLKEITRQTSYDFLYNPTLLKKYGIPVTVQGKNLSLENVLAEIFEDQPNLSYTIDQKTVIIRPKRIEITSKTMNLQQQIQGKITGEDGNPLTGVNILIKGTETGTTTDLYGNYSIAVPTQDIILIFSRIGFVTQEVPTEGRKEISIVLLQEDRDIDEVVVVAFGQQKKTDLIGAVTSINPSELNVPSSNLTTALAGRLAGVIAYQRSGEPGQDNADFFIRGVTTFGYKTDPLILIDGVELTSTDLARLQPDDIASFSIMKDATATALYGARGANGVILVTTKEGKEGPAKISFRLENSISTPTQNVELADPVTYMKLHNEAVRTRNPDDRLPYLQSKIDNTIAGLNPYMYPAVDWRKELFKDYTMNQRANMSISGGGKVTKYYVAGTFNQDNGVLKVDNRNNFNNNINLKSYLLRSNVTVSLFPSTEMGVRLYGSFDDYVGPIDSGTGLYNKVMRSNPVLFPAYYPITAENQHVSHIMFGNAEAGDDQLYINPYADMVKGYRNYSRSLMMAQLELRQDLSSLTEGLSFRVLGNTNRRSYFSVTRSYQPFYYEANNYNRHENTFRLRGLNEREGTEYLDYNLGNRTISTLFYLESALNYNRTFNEKHGTSGMLVYIMRNELNTDGANLQESLPYRNLGLSGRFTYSYDNRYLAEFNFGFNGSERFHRDHRFGFFPAAGVAWHVSNEKFWEPLAKHVNLLKLRGTYGIVGNDAIGSAADRFFYLSNINMNSSARGASFGTEWNYNINGVAIERYENRDITWETAEKVNLGIEIGLWNKIGIQADIFSEYRRNILMTRASIPTTMGLAVPIRANVGEASGRGVDISVDYKHSFGLSGAWLTARGNFTYATSRYEVYEEPDYSRNPHLSRVGMPISQQWGYVAERLFIDDEDVSNSPPQSIGAYMAGDIKYRDINGDGQISTLDRVPIGNPTTPEIVYGFGFSSGYKRFDLSAFFQGLTNESFWISTSGTNTTHPFVGNRQMLQAYAEDHWSESNRQNYALWPRLSAVSVANNNAQSTWFMRDGTFLRLKTVEFGYTIPKDRLKRLGMDSFRLYLSGINLLTWSRFKLWDIEMAGNGLGYPIQKTYNFGVLLNF